MTGAVFGVVAGALQLVVPSYGLRLVRRFGAQRVGWFLVTAFMSLATLHLLEPSGANSKQGLTLDFIYAVGSVLLVIGMAHLDTFFSQRDQSHSDQELLRARSEAMVKKETASLARANEELLQEIARCKQAEAVLQKSEGQYRFLFTENPQPMLVLDLREHCFLAVNNAALRQYGFTEEEFMQLTLPDLLPDSAMEEFMKGAAKSCAGAEPRSCSQHYRKDKTVVDVEVAARDFNYAGSPARLMVIHNLTHQRQREHDLFQARKMEFVGQIAGGVAHHFNNILTVIENHASLLRQKPSDPASTEQLQEITLAVTRGSNLTYQLLAAGGQQLLQPKPVDLNRLVHNLNLILRRTAGEKVIYQNFCGTNALPIVADPQVIEQILMHLVKNARDAISSRGMITISTAVVRVEELPVKRGSDTGPAEFVRLTVRDNGCGMSPEIRAHLFEPFFTTKEPGVGNGLGLASVFGAVRQHWGWVECTSEIGSGTEFRIFLPCAEESLLPTAADLHASTLLDKGTILLVDPDDRSRGVARYILNRHGYRIIEADSVSIALLLWEGQARNIALLLTDLVLPGASGFDLANQLLQKRPDLKVIYACNPGSETKNQLLLPEGLKVITKPYRSDELLESVEELLPQS